MPRWNQRLAQTTESLCELRAFVVKLPDCLKARGDLVQSLLDAIEFHLRSISKVLDILWRLLQMMADGANNFAATLAQQENADSTQQYSQAPQAIGNLFALIHPFRDPRFRTALN